MSADFPPLVKKPPNTARAATRAAHELRLINSDGKVLLAIAQRESDWRDAKFGRLVFQRALDFVASGERPAVLVAAGLYVGPAAQSALWIMTFDPPQIIAPGRRLVLPVGSILLTDPQKA